MHTLLLLSCLMCTAAYRVGTHTSRNLQLSAVSSKSIRAGVVAVLASGILQLQPSGPAMAANYGGFGSTYSEVVAPKDAVIDSELASSEDFKKGLEGLTKVSQAVKTLKEDFSKNGNLDVIGRVRSDLNAAEVRTSLNKYSSAFSEETQRGSDRLIRQVIQGITELEREGLVKEGKARSGPKTAAVGKRLASISDSLDVLVQYYQK